MMESKLHVKIQRKAPISLYPFRDFFQGFEQVPPVRALFGTQTEKVLRGLKVEFFSFRFGYMGTSEDDGHILISSHHLKTSEFRTVYLDIVHELCHVKQFLDGKKLFSREYEYMDNPIEIEAYDVTVKEAQRLGMTDAEIIEHLRVEWVEEKAVLRLAKRLGLKVPAPKAKRKRSRRRA